jgi:hypothetical protein
VDTVPREVHGGILYHVGVLGLNVTADILHKNVESGSIEQPIQYSAGIEKWIAASSFVVRCGGRENEITGGIGFSWNNMVIDYAVIFNLRLSQDTAGTHIVGLTYRFGQGENYQ